MLAGPFSTQVLQSKGLPVSVTTVCGALLARVQDRALATAVVNAVLDGRRR